MLGNKEENKRLQKGSFIYPILIHRLKTDHFSGWKVIWKEIIPELCDSQYDLLTAAILKWTRW